MQKAQEQCKKKWEFKRLECGGGETKLGFMHQETVDKDISERVKLGATWQAVARTSFWHNRAEWVGQCFSVRYT